MFHPPSLLEAGAFIFGEEGVGCRLGAMLQREGEEGSGAGVKRGTLAAHVVLVLAVCVGVYWVKLGGSSLAMSEGMRAIPAWEMVERGEWAVPHLFEQAYLRKPPGVQWMIALSGWVFGETEFGARVPSALAMTVGALMTMWFGGRWFGWRWAVFGGLAHALTPLFWYAGRSAEIEAPHQVFVQLFTMAGIDYLVRGSGWRMLALVVVGVAGAGLTKGPAGLPCVVGVAMGGAMSLRSWRVAGSIGWWAAVACGAAVAGGVIAWVAMRAGPMGAVTQSPAGFLWDMRKVGAIVFLPLIALGAAVPTSFAMVWLVRESLGDERATRVARGVLWAVVVSLCVYAVVGISNNRYAMPALAAVPVAMAWCVREAEARRARSGWARFVRRAVPWMLAGVAVMAGVNVAWSEERRERISGRQAGEMIAKSLKDGDEVWANQVVEYRAEVLWYAERACAREGRSVRMRWMPGVGAGATAMPPSGTLVAVLLPRDPAVSVGEYERAAEGWELVWRGLVHKYEVELRRAP